MIDFHTKTLGELEEIKANTGSQTIQAQVEELKLLGIIEIIKYDKNKLTGRPFTSVRLTEYGKSLINFFSNLLLY